MSSDFIVANAGWDPRVGHIDLDIDPPPFPTNPAQPQPATGFPAGPGHAPIKGATKPGPVQANPLTPMVPAQAPAAPPKPVGTLQPIPFDGDTYLSVVRLNTPELESIDHALESIAKITIPSSIDVMQFSVNGNGTSPKSGTIRFAGAYLDRLRDALHARGVKQIVWIHPSSSPSQIAYNLRDIDWLIDTKKSSGNAVAFW